MKTAISIPDPLFQAGERAAERLGLSRSELYATALAAYLHEHRHQDITARLNAVYAEEASTLDPVIAHIQALSLPKDDW